MLSDGGASDIALLLITLIAGVWDLRTGRIPNLLTYGAIGIGFVLALFQGQGAALSSFVGFLVGFAIFAVAFKAGMMGGGDVKLMGAIGALKGFPFVIYVMYYACAVTAVVAFSILVYRGVALATLRDIGRTLFSGIMAREWALPPARADLKIPFGAALSVASQVALVGSLLGWTL